MGLRASDFDHNEVKKATIVDMKVDSRNETTITLEHADGSTHRVRVPAGVLRICEYYRTHVA